MALEILSFLVCLMVLIIKLRNLEVFVRVIGFKSVLAVVREDHNNC